MNEGSGDKVYDLSGYKQEDCRLVAALTMSTDAADEESQAVLEAADFRHYKPSSKLEEFIGLILQPECQMAARLAILTTRLKK